MKQEENKAFRQTEPAELTVTVRNAPSEAAVAAQTADKRQKLHRLILGLALVFFLFSVIFIIPVGRLPGLRNLSWRMGFSAQDTQSMSFFRTLLAWAGDANRRRLSDKAGQTDAVSLFDRNQTQGFNANGPRSGLFDLRVVNASRRAQGLAPDGLAGAYALREGEQAASAVNKPVSALSQDVQQQTAAKNAEEVFFGTDASVAARAAAGGANKGSADTAKLVAQAPIAGAASSDWLAMAVDKASLLTNVQLDRGLAEASQIPVGLTNIGGSLKAGQKPQRDLATVWLMSKAANKAQQLLLKKQLAAAGYMAMEIPKKVYDTSGMSAGVHLAGNEVVESFEDVNQQLLEEEQCRKITGAVNEQLSGKLDESRGLIKTIRSSVPKDCGAGIAAWKENLLKIQTNCRSVKDTFSNMKMACGVKIASEGRCETVRLDAYVSDLEGACAALAQAQEAGATEEEIAELEAARDEVIDGLSDAEVADSFNLSTGEGDKGGSNDFFPVTEANTSWLTL